MPYILRTYQKEAADAAVGAFQRGSSNGLLVLPTASGKSLVIADIASRLDSPLLVFQPSVEILRQNFEKICSYGITDVGVYSASMGDKNIRRITLATIGSVHNHMDDFRLFKYCLIDEAHGVSSRGGMYNEFILDRKDRVVIGLTASPYRLERAFEGASILTFLTRTHPRVFSKVLYVCQTGDLLRRGFISPVEYTDLTSKISFDIGRVKVNSTGADYDDESLRQEYERSRFMYDLEMWTQRILQEERNGILVFTRFVKESMYLVERLKTHGISAEVVSGSTPKNDRARIVNDFKSGRLKVLSNANCMTMGFDYPALDTVILASPTRSLARYYQQVGRVVRVFEGKRAKVIDMCGSYKRFGAFEDLRIENPLGGNRWVVTSNGRPLTGELIK